MSKKVKKPQHSAKKSVLTNLLLGIFLLAIVLVIGAIFLSNVYIQSRAAPEVVINTDELTRRSSVTNDSKITQFVLESRRGKNLFQAKNRDISTILTTLDRGIHYQNANLLPSTVVENTRLARNVDDTQDSFLKERGFNLKSRHLIFQQQLQNIPVLGSSLSMHMAEDNTVYRMSANLATDETVPQAKISDDDAKNIALEEAKKDTTDPDALEVRSSNRTIVNKKLLGLSDDSNNYLTLAVNINTKILSGNFPRRYYIDLVSGQIVYQEPLYSEALSRSLYDCTGNPTNCPRVRAEGGAPSNAGDADRAYDLFGQIYDFWKTNFNRDSFDNAGAPFNILVNISGTIKGDKPEHDFVCPNASWILSPYEQWVFCKGLVLNDVAAHEYTHAVVEHTANLGTQNQSGALNEGLADVFGHAFSPENWDMGEGSSVGAFRSMDDPTRPRQVDGLRSPDRLFSPYYYCGVNQLLLSHINNGVLNKAFYLMVDGQNFNGCQVAGQGLDKIIPIFYRALTVYLTPTSNYGSLFDALNRACADLYSDSSATCATVKSAMQATEMDQQNPSVQLGPRCQNLAEKQPSCQQAPTSSPTQAPTSAPVITSVPTQSIPTSSPSSFPTSIPTGSPTASPTGSPTSIQGQSTLLNLSLRFQGVAAAPRPDLNGLDVQVSVAGGVLSTPISKVVHFTSDVHGIWRAPATFTNIPAGSGYRILIKGPKQVQKKICDIAPSESFPGTYRCGEGIIELHTGLNELNFSGILQMAGDLTIAGQQDGLINALDLVTIVGSIGSANPDAVKVADVNLDGIVDSQDFSLVIATLSQKFDDE